MSVPPWAKRPSLLLSLVDGCLHAVMLGVSESYLGALAVQLGHRDLALGLLITVPLASGALAQLACGALVRLVGGRKRLVVAGASIQALSHLGFMAIAWTHETRLWPFLLAKTCFLVTGSVMAPAWNVWIARLTAGISRQHYFAWRSAIIQVVLLGAFLSAGFYLEQQRQLGQALPAFALLHGVGLLARGLSALALTGQKRREDADAFTTRTFAMVGLAIRTAHWRAAFFLAAFMSAAQLAVPFFTPYMLRTLQLDFVAYAALTSVSILTKAFVFPVCRPLGERIGLRNLLLWGAIGASIVPVLWADAESYGALVGAQVVGGTAWAAIEYTSFLVLLHSADERCRLEFLSLAASLSGVGQVVGSVFGGLLAHEMQISYEHLFVVSALARGAATLLFLGPALRPLVSPDDPLATRLRPLPRLFWRAFSVRPGAGAVRRPIMEEQRDEDTPAV